MYTNEQISENEFNRTFDVTLDELELVWHEDEYDRKVTPLNENDWEFQFDNQVPQSLKKGESIFIKKGQFHRILKGTTPLSVNIKEYGR